MSSEHNLAYRKVTIRSKPFLGGPCRRRTANWLAPACSSFGRSRSELIVWRSSLGPAAVRQRARRSYSSDFSRQQVAAAPTEHRYLVRTTHRHINRERPICWSVAKLGRAFQQKGGTTNTASKAASCAPCRGHYHGKNRTLNPSAKLFIDCAREVARPMAKLRGVQARHQFRAARRPIV